MAETKDVRQDIADEFGLQSRLGNVFDFGAQQGQRRSELMCGIAKEPALPLDVCINLMQARLSRAGQRLEFDRNLIEVEYRRLRCPRVDWSASLVTRSMLRLTKRGGQEIARPLPSTQMRRQQNNRKKIAEDE